MKMLTIFLLVFAIKTTNLTESHSSGAVDFTINNAGFEVKGSMKVTRTEIVFDPDHLNKSYVEVIVDPSTVQTGIAIRDKHLQRSDYFDVLRYPEILIQSRGFKKTGKHDYIGKFAITIKSTMRIVSIPFTAKRVGEAWLYEGSFNINRLDFGLGEESLTLDNIVKVDVKGKAVSH